jgi:hypothetical protein
MSLTSSSLVATALPLPSWTLPLSAVPASLASFSLRRAFALATLPATERRCEERNQPIIPPPDLSSTYALLLGNTCTGSSGLARSGRLVGIRSCGIGGLRSRGRLRSRTAYSGGSSSTTCLLALRWHIVGVFGLFIRSRGYGVQG